MLLQEIYQIHNNADQLWRALKTCNQTELRSVLEVASENICNALFSGISGRVPLNSPKSVITIFSTRLHGQPKPLFALDHTLKNAKEYVSLNMRENYYDLINDALLGPNVIKSAKLVIYYAMTACLDLEHKTMHHVYHSNDRFRSVERFANDMNQNGKYLLLDSVALSHFRDVGHGDVITQDVNSKAHNGICIVTYLPAHNVTPQFRKLARYANGLRGFHLSSIHGGLVYLKSSQQASMLVCINPKYAKEFWVKTYMYLILLVLRSQMTIIKELVKDPPVDKQDVESTKIYYSNVFMHKKHVKAALKKDFFGNFDTHQLEFCILLSLRLKHDFESKYSTIGGTSAAKQILDKGFKRTCRNYLKKIGADAGLDRISKMTKLANSSVDMPNKLGLEHDKGGLCL